MFAEMIMTFLIHSIAVTKRYINNLSGVAEFRYEMQKSGIFNSYSLCVCASA